ncbi:MAG: diacylglycerol kinase [Candidatus Saccharibacteria bacterium]|nr:diacylglycerol kinase [Candidatus Saccharibacteria bacterium]
MQYQKPDKKNLFVNIWKNIVDSNHGLAIMFKESSTVRRLIPLEIIIGAIIGIIAGFNPREFIILGFTIVVLFTVETMNTAVEEVNDLVTLEENEKVKRSKDMASGAVWIWHMMYIAEALFFLICHLVHFAWWAHLIPG